MSEGKISQHIFIHGTAGKLEAIYNPNPDPKFITVVCHPHPLYQGTMHNKVAVTLAKVLSEMGGSVVRFNFRGVMESEGKHENGVGEEDDVRSALEYIVSQTTQSVPIVIAGFSFGAWVGLKFGAKDERVKYLIGLGLPVRMFEATYLFNCHKPKLIMYGTEDNFNAMENLEKFLPNIASPKKEILIDHADHFFTGKLNIVSEHVRTWIKETVK